MLSKMNTLFSKGDQPGIRSKKIDIGGKNDWDYNPAPKTDETIGKTNISPPLLTILRVLDS